MQKSVCTFNSVYIFAHLNRFHLNHSVSWFQHASTIETGLKMKRGWISWWKPRLTSTKNGIETEMSGLLSIRGKSRIQGALDGCVWKRTMCKRVSNWLVESGWEFTCHALVINYDWKFHISSFYANCIQKRPKQLDVHQVASDQSTSKMGQCAFYIV